MKKPTIEELEERIKALEARPVYIYPPTPVYLHPVPMPYIQNIYRCPQCGSTTGCMHVTC